MPKILTSEERARRWAENAKKNAERKEERLPTITKTYTVRVKKPSEIYMAIEKAAKNLGIQTGTYLRIALVEKLKNDGYMAENSDEE